MALPGRTVNVPVMLADGRSFPILVAVAKATLGDADSSDSDKAGAAVVLALERGEPLTRTEISCALTYLFNLLTRHAHRRP